jgi:hypothetical protein
LTNWDISRGFIYVCIIYIAGRISATVRAGDIIFFCLAGPVGYFTGKIINPLYYPVKRYTPGPEIGPDEKHFVFSVYFIGRISEAAMGGQRSS